MKKMFSLLLSLLLLSGLATGVFAAETAYITDELDRVEPDALKGFNEDAAKLKEDYGVGVFLAYVKGHADDVPAENIVGEEKDYVLLLMGERGTRIYTGGKGAEIFSESEDRDRLGYVHDEQDEWSDGISRYLEVAEEYLEDAMPDVDEPIEIAPDLTKIDNSSEKKENKQQDDEGFPAVYLIPILAAVIGGVLGVIITLRKKKA